MEQVNIHYAKTHLSSLLDMVSHGNQFIIAKAGKPLAKVVPIEETKQSPIGFLKGQIVCQENFDRVAEDEIVEMFYGDSK